MLQFDCRIFALEVISLLSDYNSVFLLPHHHHLRNSQGEELMIRHYPVTADGYQRTQLTRHMLLYDRLNPGTLQSGNMTSHISKKTVCAFSYQFI